MVIPSTAFSKKQLKLSIPHETMVKLWPAAESSSFPGTFNGIFINLGEVIWSKIAQNVYIAHYMYSNGGESKSVFKFQIIRPSINIMSYLFEVFLTLC